MPKTYDVVIQGRGVVAHTLALLLARDRLSVALVDTLAPASDKPDIRAYALNAASRRLLDSVRAWPADEAVTPIRQMWVSEPDTHQPAALQLHPPAGETALGWMVDVPTLTDTLAQALHFQAGIERLSGPAPARLTVICEGKDSRSRQDLGIDWARTPYPHTAVAARFRCERPHGAVARQWFVQGQVLALLPLDGEQGHTVGLVWSLPHDEAAAHLRSDPTSLAHAVQSACDHALGAMTLLGEPAGWPLGLAQATRWVQPRLALAGDAAHTLHPLAGQGLNVGLADAEALARVLREREYWRDVGDLRLLRRYERERRAAFADMAWVTDRLFGLFGHTDSRVQTLRRLGLQAFNQCPPLKSWVARQAAGLAPRPSAHPI